MHDYVLIFSILSIVFFFIAIAVILLVYSRESTFHNKKRERLEN